MIDMARGKVIQVSPLMVALSTSPTIPLPVAFVSAPDPAALRAGLTIGARVTLLARRLPGGDAELVLIGREG